MEIIFFQAEDGIRDIGVTGVQTCALPICRLRQARHEDRRDPPRRQADRAGRGPAQGHVHGPARRALLLRGRLRLRLLEGAGARTQAAAQRPLDRGRRLGGAVKLEVELRTSEALGPGATVAGTVRVPEGGRSRSLAVALHYVERSPEYTHIAVTVPGPVLHTGDLRGGESFEFAIP